MHKFENLNLLLVLVVCTVAEPVTKKPRLFELPSDTSDSDDEPLVQPSSASLAVQRYKAELQLDAEQCPLEWWKIHAGSHPVIASLARMYLATPATTVPCERLFSVSGNIVSKKRASLTPTNVDKLVCLNNWLHLKL